MNRIGIIRLERLVRRGNALSSQSSIVKWLQAMSERVAAVGLLAPVGRADVSVSGDAGRVWWRPRDMDRVFAIPNASGFARVWGLSPLIVWQLLRLRGAFPRVICRVPEHGSMLVLPLLDLLGFRVTVWLVANRADVEAAAAGRRGNSLRSRLGVSLSRLNGKIERHYLRKWPVISNGSEMARYVEGLRHGRGDVLTVVSTTLRTAEIPSEPVRRERAPAEPLRLLYVGRIAPDKGLGDLIRAVKLLRERRGARRVELDLVGWPAHGETERLSRELRRLELEDVVHLIGPRAPGEPLFHCFRRADLFVLPSPTEGTPRVLVEAMAFGLPIVATRVGGVPDLVEPGRHGLLVPPGNAEALADAIGALEADPARRHRMSAENAATARRHTVEHLADRMLAFVMANHPSTPRPA